MPKLPAEAITAAARVLGNDCHGGPPDGNDMRLAADVLAAAWAVLVKAWSATPSPSREQVRSVACPSCGARTGEQCRAKGYGASRTWPTAKVHAGRRRAAETSMRLGPELPGA